MNENSNEEKTESPTESHIKKFRQKGETKYSRELHALLIMLCGFSSLWWMKDQIFFQFYKMMFNGFSFNFSLIASKKNVLLDIMISLKEIFLCLFPFLLCLLLVILLPSIFFSGIEFNFQSFKFNFNKMNPFIGVKRIFSFQSTIEIFKMILKLFFIGSVSFWYLSTSFSQMLELVLESPKSAFLHGFQIISHCCILVILGLIPIVIIDIFWKEFTHYKKLRMTRQEIKNEHKEMEGNPNIKMRIRQQMKAIARRRMMSDVPKADVIITNPVHYSVALQYNTQHMHAPKVIAKGAGVLALKIQNIGVQYNISVISAPSLARSLYRHTEIGQYIPGLLYKAVAEVLAWVWKVRKWKKEGGSFPQAPKNIFVPSDLNFIGKRKNND